MRTAWAEAQRLADRVGRDRVMHAHRHVVGLVAAHLPVVAMPLGTIYPDEAAVIHLLAVRRAEFTAALLNVAAAAATQRDAPPYAALLGPRSGQPGWPSRVPMTRAPDHSVEKNFRATRACSPFQFEIST